MRVVKDSSVIESYIEEISYLADSERNSFGFLSKSAYQESLYKNSLWIILNDDDELLGYLMFGGKFPTLKVYQIYAKKEFRGRGVSDTLLDSFKQYGTQMGYSTIQAKVADDLDSAMKFWERSGFKTISKIKGGKTTGRILNIYVYETNPSLFSQISHVPEDIYLGAYPAIRNDRYVLDVNVLIDFFNGDQDRSQTIDSLMAKVISREIDVCVTPEFPCELKRSSKFSLNDRVYKFQESLPHEATISEEKLDHLINELKEIVFPHRELKENDKSDLTHLAYCLYYNLGGLITSEKAILRKSNTLTQRYGIEVISPSEFHMDNPYQTQDSGLHDSNSVMMIESKSVIEYDDILDVEDISTILNTLKFKYLDKPLSSASSTLLTVAKSNDGKILGFILFLDGVRVSRGGKIFVYISSKQSALQSIEVAEFFMKKCLSTLICKKLEIFKVYIIDKNEHFSGLAIKRGFFHATENSAYKGFILLKKINMGKYCYISNWGDKRLIWEKHTALSLPESIPSLKSIKNNGLKITATTGKPQYIHTFDKLVSPTVMLYPQRKASIIPIQENLAEELLGRISQQASFLCSDAYKKLENVYYKSPKGSGLIKKGDIILFYVSKTLKSVVGLANVTSSEVVDVDDAIRKYNKQGVFSEEELRSFAEKNKSKLHMITFDNFVLFDRQVELTDLKSIGVGKAGFISVENISHEALKEIVIRGFDS